MPKYTEGEKNLQYYLQYGTYPAPPPPPQRMGNNISEIVGTHYQGERTPRQIQKLPLYNYYQRERFAPTAIDVPSPFAGTTDENNGRLIALGGLALLFLILFDIVGFKGY